MTKRFFQVVYLSDSTLQHRVDAIRFVAEPTEKTSAHVTVAGPYNRREDVSSPSLSIKGTSLHVFGVGNFFKSGQNTVFLRCGSDHLRSVWHKKDFGFNPHITIYDGNDHSFAVSLFEEISAQNVFFNVPVTDVELLKTIKGQQAFDLLFGLDWSFIRWAAGREIDEIGVKNLASWERKMIIQRMLTKLTQIDGASSTKSNYASV